MHKKKMYFTIIFMLISLFAVISCSKNNDNIKLENNVNGDNNTPTKITVQQLISSNDSNFAILSDGSIYAWGYNKYGQLGVGQTNNINIPTKVKVLKDIKQLIPMEYSYSVFAIMKDGSLYAWGDNSHNHLGIGNHLNTTVPAKVVLQSKVKQMAYLGSIHTKISVFAIMEDGSIYAWGDNTYGQLGLGDNINRHIPTKVNINGNVQKIITLSTSDLSSVFAIMKDGSTYAWGNNTYGQLGVGDNINRNIPTKVNINGNIQNIIISNYSSMFAVMENGSLYSWGYNTYGQLGLGDNIDRNIPTKVNINGNIQNIIISNYGSMFAVIEDGSLYSWGDNTYGQLGLGDNINRNIPTKIDLNGNLKKLLMTTMPMQSFFALIEDGSLYSWGDNTYGQLGLGIETNTNIAQKVIITESIKELVFPYVNCSAFAITQNGNLYTWGDNRNGYLGLGNIEDKYNIPTKLNIKEKINKIHTTPDGSRFLIKEDNTLYSWGYNKYGHLGVGDKIDKYIPTNVILDKKIKQLVTKDLHSIFAITEDGSLYAWGQNSSGQLGLGDEIDRNTPEKVIFDN